MGKGSGDSETRMGLSLSEARFRYPRTPHLPWSSSKTDDDVSLSSLEQFAGKPVVVTEKLDGENTTMSRDYIHARSPDGIDRTDTMRQSRTRVKAVWGEVRYQIPEGWRVCGENMVAEHSISYDRLPGYFIVFSVFNAENQALSWPETEAFARKLNLPTAPVLYQGVWDEKTVKGLKPESRFGEECEGYVVRLADGFSYQDYSKSTAKCVRENHVQTDEHWTHQTFTLNRLAE